MKALLWVALVCSVLPVALGNACVADQSFSAVHSSQSIKLGWIDQTLSVPQFNGPGTLDSVQIDVAYSGTASYSVTTSQDTQNQFQPTITSSVLGVAYPASGAASSNFISSLSFDNSFSSIATPSAGTYQASYPVSGTLPVLLTSNLAGFIGSGTTNIGVAVSGVPSGSYPAGDPGHTLDADILVGVTVTVSYQFSTLSLTKKLNGATYPSTPGASLNAGSSIVWTFEVTNVGTADLTALSVTDSQFAGSITCPSGQLVACAVATCSAVDVARVTNQYTNIATAHAVGVDSSIMGTSPHSFTSNTAVANYVGQSAPGIRLIKYTNDVDTATSGNVPTLVENTVVTWKFEVTNTGSQALQNIIVIDDQEGLIPCPSTLGIGNSYTCSITGVAFSADYTNIATVQAQGDTEGDNVQDVRSNSYHGTYADIQLVKLTNDANIASEEGAIEIVAQSPVTWKFQVTNTGTAALSSVTVIDSDLGTVPCAGMPNPLGAGASHECAFTGTAGFDDYANHASAIGWATPDRFVSAEDDSWYTPIVTIGSVSIVKRTNGVFTMESKVPRVRAGYPVTWTYEVTNLGGNVLTSVGVADDRLDASQISCPSDAALLLPGSTVVCSATGIAQKCGYTNVGCVTTYPPFKGRVCSGSGYNGIHPGLSMRKYTNNLTPERSHDENNPPCIQAGCEVVWTYIVSNTGDDLLTNVNVYDDQLKRNVWCPVNKLSPWQTITCLSRNPEEDAPQHHHYDGEGEGSKHHGGEPHSANDEAQPPRAPRDVARAGSYHNVATAYGSPVVGGPDLTAVDENWYVGVQAGMRLTVTVNNVAAKGGVGTFVDSCPLPKPVDTCTTCKRHWADAHAGGKDGQESHGEHGGGEGKSGKSGKSPSWQGGEDYTSGAAVKPGDSLSFQFVVTNTGLEWINLLYISFPESHHGSVPFISINANSDVNCPNNTLAPGATMTCTASSTVATYGSQWLKVRATGVGSCDGVVQYRSDALARWFSPKPQRGDGKGERGGRGEGRHGEGRHGEGRSGSHHGEGKGEGHGPPSPPPANPLPPTVTSGGCDAVWWISNPGSYPAQWTQFTKYYIAAGLTTDPVAEQTLGKVLHGDDSGLNPFYRTSSTALLNAATNPNFGVSLATVQADIAAALTAYFVQGDNTLVTQYLQLFSSWEQPC